MSNRKPSWLLWWAAVLIGLPVLYVASFGPACWIACWTNTDQGFFFQYFYWPIGKICLGGDSLGAVESPVEYEDLPRVILSAYAGLGLAVHESVAIPAQYGEYSPYVFSGRWDW